MGYNSGHALTDDPELFGIWQERWADLTEFEILPVVGSAEAARLTSVAVL